MAFHCCACAAVGISAINLCALITKLSSFMQELDPLATLPRLESLSLLDNEVTKVKHYRSATAQPAVHCLVSRLLQLAVSYLPARPTPELQYWNGSDTFQPGTDCTSYSAANTCGCWTSEE